MSINWAMCVAHRTSLTSADLYEHKIIRSINGGAGTIVGGAFIICCIFW